MIDILDEFDDRSPNPYAHLRYLPRRNIGGHTCTATLASGKRCGNTGTRIVNDRAYCHYHEPTEE